MKVEITRINDAFQLAAENESGHKVILDGAESIGGGNDGLRPMQLVLAALGSCSAMDLISILKKQKQDLKALTITVEGEREANVYPSAFTHIRLHYRIEGGVDEGHAGKAIELALYKYCSVQKMLSKSAEISHTLEIIPS